MNWLKRLYYRYMAGAVKNHCPLWHHGRQLRPPRNLNEAISSIEVMVKPADKARILQWSEAEFIAKTHHNLGRLIRSQWGLWDENSPLHKWFMRSRIWHADDMSGIILTSYYRHIHDQPLMLKDQFDGYIEYWAKNAL